MKRLLLTTVFLCLLVSTSLANPWRLGLQTGATKYGLSGDSISGVKLDDRKGWAAGLIVETKITDDIWLSFQPTYEQKGAASRLAVPRQTETIPGPSLELDFIALPLLARIVSGNGRIFVVGGLSPAFLQNAELDDNGVTSDYSDFVNSFDIAAVFGAGFVVPIGNPILSFELRYEQSITNMATNEDGADVLPVRFRSSGLLLAVGVLLPLGEE